MIRLAKDLLSRFYGPWLFTSSVLVAVLIAA